MADQLAQLYDRAGRKSDACRLYKHVAGGPATLTGALINAGVCNAADGEHRHCHFALAASARRQPGGGSRTFQYGSRLARQVKSRPQKRSFVKGLI